MICCHLLYRDTLPNEVELNTKNVSVGYVGQAQEFKILDETETGDYLKLIEGEERHGGGSGAAASALGSQEAPIDAPVQAMDTE